jgi:hypothetical protein
MRGAGGEKKEKGQLDRQISSTNEFLAFLTHLKTGVVDVPELTVVSMVVFEYSVSDSLQL